MNIPENSQFIANCPKGLEALLKDELSRFGAEISGESVGQVRFEASLKTAYTACLWSRLANRVLLVLWQDRTDTSEGIYGAVQSIDWLDHIAPDGSLAVDFQGTGGEIRNSHFGALKIKDAIVDQFNRQNLARPNVDTKFPDLRLYARLKKGEFTLAIDLAGESLHRRGYREKGALAPLKENLAAAILIRADWPGVASKGGALIDPMCGSGTLLIEGAMMAMDIAPGLQRKNWGFTRWQGHIPAIWQSLLEDARERRALALTRQWPEIRGYDASGSIVSTAESNIEMAGLRGKVRVSRKELSEFSRPTHTDLPFGLVVANPPYGERLGDEASLVHLYSFLGQALRRDFQGWQAAMITGNPNLGKRMGLRSHKQYQLLNGSIPAKLLLFDVQEKQFVNEKPDAEGGEIPQRKFSGGAEMFANRLRKNLKRVDKWAKRQTLECYRVYDADMPEYAVAIDRYGKYVHVAEYVAPANIPEETSRDRLRDVIDVIPSVMQVHPENVVLKERRRQRGTEQYTRKAQREEWFEIEENPVKLLVNLHDYLDTGVFLDHRDVRRYIGEQAKGKRFLNLFCYTATASVHAGVGGARYSTSVDMSQTYLNWAQRNLALNGLSESRHRVERADCLKWLEQRAKLNDEREKYDLILLDPPTFSNSKKMDETLDIQRDHAGIVELAMACLAEGGELIFSNNRRGFTLDESVAERFTVQDKTRWSIPEDFSRRSQAIHHCYFISHKAQSAAESETHTEAEK